MGLLKEGNLVVRRCRFKQSTVTSHSSTNTTFRNLETWSEIQALYGTHPRCYMQLFTLYTYKLIWPSIYEIL